jgi:hypothetical protein
LLQHKDWRRSSTLPSSTIWSFNAWTLPTIPQPQSHLRSLQQHMCERLIDIDIGSTHFITIEDKDPTTLVFGCEIDVAQMAGKFQQFFQSLVHCC